MTAGLGLSAGAREARHAPLIPRSTPGGHARAVSVGGVTRPTFVPGVPRDWTGSPRIELGYRLADGAGAFLVSYRSLVTSGGATENNFDPNGAGFVKSLLNLNVVDIQYRSGPCEFAPLWDLTWDVGARIGAAYYNSRAAGGV